MLKFGSRFAALAVIVGSFFPNVSQDLGLLAARKAVMVLGRTTPVLATLPITGAPLLAEAADQLKLRLKPLAAGGGGNVLSAADITYDGMIRMPASGTDTLASTGSITGRVVAGDQHLLFYGSYGGPIDYQTIYEIDVSGLTPNTVLGSSPQATTVADWGDDYGPVVKRSWDGGGTEQTLTGANSYNRGILWNEDTGLLYIMWSISYVDEALWSMAAIDSPNDTGCGPWRFEYPQSVTNAGQITDGTRTHTALQHPTTGKLYTTGGSKSDHTVIPWGPNLVGAIDFPTCATTGGFGMTPIEMPTTLMDFFFPSTPHSATATYGVDGSVLATIKQFQFPSTITYIHEIYTAQPLQADPALNGGKGTWSDENSGTGQAMWFEGTNKRGIIYPGYLQAAYGNDPDDCVNTTHNWYRNAANGWVKVSSETGTPTAATIMTGGTSLSTGNITGQNGAYVFFNDADGEEFLVGETVTATGWSATVDEWDENDTCNHGCSVPLATGPVSTKATNVFIIFDPDELQRVVNAEIEQYEPQASSVVDVKAEWGIITGSDNGKQSNFDCGYINNTTKKMYCVAHQADITGGNPNAMTALVHVFTIHDDPPPVRPFPMLMLAAGVAFFVLPGLTRRRMVN